MTPVPTVPVPVRLEGFHAVKHALRFGASVSRIFTDDPDAIRALVDTLAPDIESRLIPRLEIVDAAQMRELAPRPPASPLVAFAASRPADVADVLSGGGDAPVVLLEDPRHAGNLGAAVRVAAAASARAVLTTGSIDPWSTAALRGSAGLHYAVGVAGVEADAVTGPRQLIALDPQGDRLTAADLADGPILVFGTERDGLTESMLARVDRRLALPMAPGVSSLNLATAVSATLFAWRLARP